MLGGPTGGAVGEEYGGIVGALAGGGGAPHGCAADGGGGGGGGAELTGVPTGGAYGAAAVARRLRLPRSRSGAPGRSVHRNVSSRDPRDRNWGIAR